MNYIIERASINFRDVRFFGIRFLLRHFARLSGATTSTISIPSIGDLCVRIDGSDMDTVRQVFQDKEYESPVAMARIKKRYAEILASGRVPVIADIGANIGSASLWFKSQYPEAFIVSVEPSPGNLKILYKNIGSKPGFSIFPAAIGSELGFVSVEGDGWGARTRRSATGVAVVTMSNVLQSVPNAVPLIVKIDIEGFESELFSKNTGWLNDVYAVFIEPHDWMLPGQRTSQTFQRAISQHDFEISISGENIVYVRP